MNIKEHWERGEMYRIPRCCRVQYIAELTLLQWLPDIAFRAAKLTPRGSLADGIKPCSYHAFKWLLTGEPPVPDKDRYHHGSCCDSRQLFESLGDAKIEFSHMAVYEDESDQETLVPMHLLCIGNSEPIHVTHCPWCGEPLE